MFVGESAGPLFLDGWEKPVGPGRKGGSARNDGQGERRRFPGMLAAVQRPSSHGELGPWTCLRSATGHPQSWVLPDQQKQYALELPTRSCRDTLWAL